MLAGLQLRDEGARALAAALAALPEPAPLSSIVVRENELTEPGCLALAWGLGEKVFRALTVLDMSLNPEIGDAGVVALVSGGEGLPQTLAELGLEATGCGNGGMVGLAARLPSLGRFSQLTTVPAALRCGHNPEVTEPGWTALGAVLPMLLGLAELDLCDCYGMGDGGASLVAQRAD